MRHRSVLLSLLVGLVVAIPLHAQARLHGTVRDSAQRTPLPLVEVLVEGMNLSTQTDAEGRYSLNVPLGFHTVHFRRVGYHPVTRQLRLANQDALRYDLAMLSQGQQLDSIRVVAPERPRTWPPGIDERMKEGFGQFVTDSTLRRFEHSRLSNVLQSRATGVRFKRRDGRSVAISGRGPRVGFGRAIDCYFSIWLDGVLIYEPDETGINPTTGREEGSGPPDLDRFAVVGLEAVEVYSSAQVPAKYRGGSSGCGVILLWSRTQRR